MNDSLSLKGVPDDVLLRRLKEILGASRRTEAELLAHIGEADDRRLYAGAACSSMFVYCTEVLHLSEAEAYARITAARAARRHPMLLSMLSDGRLHLSAVVRLAPHLTAGNRDELLARAIHKSKREVLELVAEIAPGCDTPDSIRRLPSTTSAARGPAVARSEVPARALPDAASPGPSLGMLPQPFRSEPPGRKRPLPIAAANETDRLAAVTSEATVIGAPEAPARIEPLAPGRYRVQFTAGAALRDKLERLLALMRTSAPDAGLAAVLEAAVTEKLERLEARRFATTAKPRQGVRSGDTQPRTRRIPAAVRRAVWRRDEGRCRYVDDTGRRCTARGGLEYHHRVPFGMGGGHAFDNVCLMCPTHNRHLAAVDFGARAVDPARRRTAGASRPGGTAHEQSDVLASARLTSADGP